MNTLKMSNSNFRIKILSIISIILINGIIFSQHRGDDLSFQEIGDVSTVNFTNSFPDLFITNINSSMSLFLNPGGLGTVNRPQVSFTGGNSSYTWRESQYYRPNRLFVTLPFYLEGYYIPDPANNDSLDYDIALDDSNYVVSEPPMGLDRFGEEAADWIKTETAQYFTGSIAIPVKAFGKKLVFAGAYEQKPLNDFDRNITYLDPHLGFTEYDMPEKVDPNKEPLRVNWGDFTRHRTGNARRIDFGVSFPFNKIFSVGIASTLHNIGTDDTQRLDRVGYFDLYKENKFSFSYDTLLIEIEGTSEFKSSQFRIGGLINKETIIFGAYLTLPQSISKTSDYKFIMESPTENITVNDYNSSLSNSLDIPAMINFGLSVKPNKAFEFFLDANQISFSEAKLSNESNYPDTLYYNVDESHSLVWSSNPKRKILLNPGTRAGIWYSPFKYLSLFTGYQYKPQVFSPDGAAFNDKGPVETSLTFGLEVKSEVLGSVKVFFTNRELKFYDSYYSNTNYSTRLIEQISVSYLRSF